MDSVTEFANTILEKEAFVDYLVNNGGIYGYKGLTKQGFRTVFAVNHLGGFLLTNLLLQKMKEQSVSRPVRVINVASVLHAFGKIDFSQMQNKTQLEGVEEMVHEYASTKLANVYFTSVLKMKTEGFDISTFSVHPGWITSELGDHFYSDKGWYEKISYRLWKIFHLQSPFCGSQPIMKCMLDDAILQYNGGYFDLCEPA